MLRAVVFLPEHRTKYGAAAQRLPNKLDFAMSATRGGSNSGKPLGEYDVGEGVVFRSGYKDLDPKVQAQFICAMNEHIQNNGGGFYNMRKYQQSTKPPGPPDILTPQQEKQQDPMDRSMCLMPNRPNIAKRWVGAL